MAENVFRSENLGYNAFLLTNLIEKERVNNHVHLLERESDIIQLKDLISDVKVLLAEYQRPTKNNEE